ncbi:unnamed protein product [Didymodactylos carnosus]|uniref:N-acetyltransferase domain-containing protein n=1 Tax=Didymodactylos carnosus TaxID=1234261 RepID=A0A814ES81_9BILA|nr:unnamed protein product [Didymodactylos carnosus]CAF3748049.1 unnamed protein product [Didymodactylos carnosus]
MNILETDRLILCHLSVHDEQFILELLNNPSWLQFIGDRNVRTLDDARAYILNGPMDSYQKFGFGLYLINLKHENHVSIGICGLIKRDVLEDIDLGFALLPEYARKGYAFEAASAVLNYAKTILGLKRIVAITSMDNHRSQNLLKKLGFTFEKLIKFANDNKELMLFANFKDDPC